MENKEEKIITKILESARNIQLTEMEKSLMRQNLTSYIGSKPQVSPLMKGNSFWHILMLKQRYVFPILLVIFVGTGTVLAAKNSLPGDVLYPIKTNINENVESLIAISPKAKAEVELSHTNIRIHEIEDLKLMGTLTPDQNTIVKDNLSKGIDRLNKQIKDLEDKGDVKSAEEINSKLEDGVDEHLQTLESIVDSTTTPKVMTASLMATAVSTTTEQSEPLTKIIKKVREKREFNARKLRDRVQIDQRKEE